MVKRMENLMTMTLNELSECILKFNKPRKPQLPYLGDEPKKLIEKIEMIPLYDERGWINLAELIQKIPEGLTHDKLYFGSNSYDDDHYDNGVACYTVTICNPKYEEQMIEYSRKKEVYNERMERYKTDKAVYDAWDRLTDEEKIEMYKQKKALLKSDKIKKLEKQLKELKNETD